MATTYAQLIAAFPKLAVKKAEEQAAIELWLEDADDRIANGAYGNAKRTNRARLLLGAHFVTLAGGGCSTGDRGGAPKSRSKGGRTVTYGDAQAYMSEGLYNSTVPGRAYIGMRRGRFGPFTL